MQLIIEKPWDFIAGQYTAVLFENKAYPFSIASSPLADVLELHIQNSPIRPLDENFAGFLAQTSELELAAPQGKAILHSTSRPLILVAGGSGFAPMKSLIETVQIQQEERKISLYWGVRHPQCFYLPNLIETWSENSNFTFVPVVSEEHDAYYRYGLVHEAVLQDFESLKGFDIYLAGPFPMSYAARESFLAKGAEQAHLFSDAFEFG